MDTEKSRMTSESLIMGVRAGREDAWIRMTSLFGPLVFKWIRAIPKYRLQSHDITDVSQEVFLAATQNIESYRHSKEKHGTFRGWLYGITRNKVHQYARDSPQDQFLTENLDQFATWDPEILIDDFEGDGEVWKLEQGNTHKAIEIVRPRLEEHTWQAFWRTVVNGERPMHVAEDLGMDSRRIRQARTRTIKRLAIEIERLNKEEDDDKIRS